MILCSFFAHSLYYFLVVLYWCLLAHPCCALLMFFGVSLLWSVGVRQNILVLLYWCSSMLGASLLCFVGAFHGLSLLCFVSACQCLIASSTSLILSARWCFYVLLCSCLLMPFCCVILMVFKFPPCIFLCNCASLNFWTFFFIAH